MQSFVKEIYLPFGCFLTGVPEDAAWITLLWSLDTTWEMLLCRCAREKRQHNEGTRRGTKLGNTLKIHSTPSPRLLVLSKLTASFQFCFCTRLLSLLTTQWTIGRLYICPLHGWGRKSTLNKGCLFCKSLAEQTNSTILSSFQTFTWLMKERLTRK